MGASVHSSMMRWIHLPLLWFAALGICGTVGASFRPFIPNFEDKILDIKRYDPFRDVNKEVSSLKTDGPIYPIIDDLKNPAEIRASTFRLKRQLGEPWYYQLKRQTEKDGKIDKLTKAYPFRVK